MTVAALLLPTLLGFLILALLLKDDLEAGLTERLCLAYPLGAGILTMQLFILGLLRVPLTLGNSSLPVVLEIVALIFWIAMNKIALLPKLTFGLRDEIADPKTPGLKKAALVLLTLWAGAKLLSVFIETGLRPIFAWDSWANWAVGAKLFYYSKSLMLDAPVQDYFAGGAVLRITSYPLHNPLMQTWIGLWAGGFDEVLVKFWMPVYVLSLAGCLYHIAYKELGRLAALGLLIIFLSSPLLSYHAIEVYSDLPLGAYLFLALASFLKTMQGKRAYVPLIALYSAEAVFTKDEALMLVAPLLLSAALFLWRTSEARQRGPEFVKLFAPLLLVAPWYAFKYSHALGLGANANIGNIEIVFHPEIILPALLLVFSLENFNVIFVFFAVLVAVGGKPTKEFLHLCAPVACYALFFLQLYMFTNVYYDHFNRGTIFFRNLLTYYPAIALLMVPLLRKQFSPSLHPSPARNKTSRKSRA